MGAREEGFVLGEEVVGQLGNFVVSREGFPFGPGHGAQGGEAGDGGEVAGGGGGVFYGPGRRGAGPPETFVPSVPGRVFQEGELAGGFAAAHKAVAMGLVVAEVSGVVVDGGGDAVFGGGVWLHPAAPFAPDVGDVVFVGGLSFVVADLEGFAQLEDEPVDGEVVAAVEALGVAGDEGDGGLVLHDAGDPLEDLEGKGDAAVPEVEACVGADDELLAGVQLLEIVQHDEAGFTKAPGPQEDLLLGDVFAAALEVHGFGHKACEVVFGEVALEGDGFFPWAVVGGEDIGQDILGVQAHEGLGQEPGGGPGLGHFAAAFLPAGDEGVGDAHLAGEGDGGQPQGIHDDPQPGVGFTGHKMVLL